jgi:hypothetical protein
VLVSLLVSLLVCCSCSSSVSLKYTGEKWKYVLRKMWKALTSIQERLKYVASWYVLGDCSHLERHRPF